MKCKNSFAVSIALLLVFATGVFSAPGFCGTYNFQTFDAYTLPNPQCWDWLSSDPINHYSCTFISFIGFPPPSPPPPVNPDIFCDNGYPTVNPIDTQCGSDNKVRWTCSFPATPNKNCYSICDYGPIGICGPDPCFGPLCLSGQPNPQYVTCTPGQSINWTCGTAPGTTSCSYLVPSGGPVLITEAGPNIESYLDVNVQLTTIDSGGISPYIHHWYLSYPAGIPDNNCEFVRPSLGTSSNTLSPKVTCHGINGRVYVPALDDTNSKSLKIQIQVWVFDSSAPQQEVPDNLNIIFYQKLKINAGPDRVVDPSIPVTLSASATGGKAPRNFFWYFPAPNAADCSVTAGFDTNKPTISCLNPGTSSDVNVVLTDSFTAPAVSDTVTITTSPAYECGPAADNSPYAFDETGYVGAFCDVGSASPASPPFPPLGGTTSWSCGVVGGTSASCAAVRDAGPVAGVCGDAALNSPYASGATGFVGDFCSAGDAPVAPPAFPVQGGIAYWTCSGRGGGADAPCSARRLSPVAVGNEVAISIGSSRAEYDVPAPIVLTVTLSRFGSGVSGVSFSVVENDLRGGSKNIVFNQFHSFVSPVPVDVLVVQLAPIATESYSLGNYEYVAIITSVHAGETVLGDNIAKAQVALVKKQTAAPELDLFFVAVVALFVVAIISRGK